jgi:hypothetical protein
MHAAHEFLQAPVDHDGAQLQPALERGLVDYQSVVVVAQLARAMQLEKRQLVASDHR